MASVVFSSLLFVTGTFCIVVGMVSELVARSRRRLPNQQEGKIEYLQKMKYMRLYNQGSLCALVAFVVVELK
jgi:hypothetical protein